jgi:hypothetical protein
MRLVNGVGVFMAKLVYDPGNAIVVAFGEAGSDSRFESGRVVC